jgi:hypothetical protein
MKQVILGWWNTPIKAATGMLIFAILVYMGTCSTGYVQGINQSRNDSKEAVKMCKENKAEIDTLKQCHLKTNQQLLLLANTLTLSMQSFNEKIDILISIEKNKSK